MKAPGTGPIPDYLDDSYETLADKAQDILRNDPAIAPHYFEQGFTFISNGQAGDFDKLTTDMLNNIKSKHSEDKYIELNNPEEVFQSLHGKGAKLVPESMLGHERQWVQGYISRRCATVNAEAIIKIYYDRCRARQNIEFILGTPVDVLIYGKHQDEVLGVTLEDGREIFAEKTIICTGAWSKDEKYRHVSCHTNLVTGLKIFQPLNGWLKILRRGAGLQNTTALKDPEDPKKTYKASYPHTVVDDPDPWIPLTFEASLREELREIFPAMANRRFDMARFCWLEQTTTGDFLISPHPKFKNLQMAIGGSFHGWKFLPLLVEFVIDSINMDLAP
ncbi:DAO domain-containing protein [Fusarium keratoplasticum]|uniref:DAO domain-containing protein n=1 Tax=Fusarium keratoplasticum TaxID=1328300 RepID=A0ACC0RC11_9HYPO|nr:DAO domain-containing protein [Fusarium keratoplasticum]KAI8680510.1 DAO domain-containing protein [Fusarium keratoplasticum]